MYLIIKYAEADRHNHAMKVSSMECVMIILNIYAGSILLSIPKRFLCSFPILSSLVDFRIVTIVTNDFRIVTIVVILSYCLN